MTKVKNDKDNIKIVSVGKIEIFWVNNKFAFVCIRLIHRLKHIDNILSTLALLILFKLGGSME